MLARRKEKGREGVGIRTSGKGLVKRGGVNGGGGLIVVGGRGWASSVAISAQ